MDPLDRDYLKELVVERDRVQGAYCGYVQGRIDEYCAQNAIDQSDTDLPLTLHNAHGAELRTVLSK